MTTVRLHTGSRTITLNGNSPRPLHPVQFGELPVARWRLICMKQWAEVKYEHVQKLLENEQFIQARLPYKQDQ